MNPLRIALRVSPDRNVTTEPAPPPSMIVASDPCSLVTVRLRIALPDGNFVIVRGQVTLPLRDVGYAVRFIDLDESIRHRIEQALEYVQNERSQN